MASPSELSLDFMPHSYSMLLKSFGPGEHQQPEPKQLEDFLACLEDERLKIEAFKRELPLCMQLLSNAVEASRQKLQAVKSSNQGSRPVLEEFIPLKSPTSDGETDLHTASKNMADKSNWMVSAQLWSQAPNIDNNSLNKQLESPNQTDMGFNITSSNMVLQDTTKQRNAGAFIPFSKDRISTGPTLPIPNLALANTNGHRLLEEKKPGAELISDCPTRETIVTPGNITVGGMIENETIRGTNISAETLTTSHTTLTNSNNTNNNSSSNQPSRKARRCWSPDLHRRFVNALQMLGGSQVATPKQIRELMKVDGLTNDEVKSHLQKYRLHTRRPSPSPQPPAGGPAAQLVVLGGIWVPPEYAAHHYGAPPHQSVGPEFYAASPHHRQLFHIHQHQQQQHMQIQMQQHHQQQVVAQAYHKASSRTHSSPESDARGIGDRSESIEDGKSESGSWKGGESVEIGRDRMKGGAGPRRDGGEESINGSDVTLKF